MDVYLLVLAVVLGISLLVSHIMQNVAFAKGYDKNAHTFAICFWLGVVGWFYVIALPDLVARKNQEELIGYQKVMTEEVIRLNNLLACGSMNAAEKDEYVELPPL